MKTQIYFLRFFLLGFYFCTVLHSQPSWVKECLTLPLPDNIDAKARVLVLRDVAEVQITANGAITNMQTAYKILNSDGESYGTIHLTASPEAKVKSLKGWIYTTDKIFKELPKENIIEVGADLNSAYYDDNKVVSATLPNVEPGTMVFFDCLIDEKGWTSFYQQFYFQTAQPVLLTKYSLTIPEGWEFKKSEWFGNEIQYLQTDNQHTWIAKMLPFVEKEPCSPSWDFLAKKVVIHCNNSALSEVTQFKNWGSVSKWCDQVYQVPAEPTPVIEQLSTKLCEGVNSLADKLKVLSEFSQKQIRYVAIEIGKERWQPRPAEKTLQNRYGDCKDKTTLMRALLRVQNISSIPVLAHTNEPVDENLTSPFQFNHCIIAIRLDNNSEQSRFKNALAENWLFFDPTDPSVKIGELPRHLQGTKVLLGMEGNSGLLTLPAPQPSQHRTCYALNGVIQPDGKFDAQVIISHCGESAAVQKYFQMVVTTQKQIEKIKRELSAVIPTLQLSEYQLETLEDSVRIKFRVTGERITTRSGSYIVFHPNIFQEPEAPALTSESRQQPIWFGEAKQLEYRISWKLPENWKSVNGNFSLQDSCQGAAISLTTSWQPGWINYSTRFWQNGELINVADYPVTRQFNQQVSRIKSHAILFTL